VNPRSKTTDAVRGCAIVRYDDGAPASAADLVTVEEPLEIRIAGEPVAVTMRTPGHDHELTLGFLFAEGLITSARDVGVVAHCGRPGDDGYGNAIEVTAAPGTMLEVTRGAPQRRGTLTTSSCGVCGRLSIEDLLARCRPVNDDTRFSARVVARLTATLRDGQVAFGETGGLHAAGIATQDGHFLHVREDVGRHNAVDKAVGRLLLEGALPARGHALVVSGRSSFEIVQKSVVAGIPLIVGVSAPSTLAIETAERANVTLIGFSRGETFNVYSHPARIDG
jgi:FdhD protein